MCECDAVKNIEEACSSRLLLSVCVDVCCSWVDFCWENFFAVFRSIKLVLFWSLSSKAAVSGVSHHPPGKTHKTIRTVSIKVLRCVPAFLNLRTCTQFLSTFVLPDEKKLKNDPKAQLGKGGGGGLLPQDPSDLLFSHSLLILKVIWKFLWTTSGASSSVLLYEWSMFYSGESLVYICPWTIWQPLLEIKKMRNNLWFEAWGRKNFSCIVAWLVLVERTPAWQVTQLVLIVTWLQD